MKVTVPTSYADISVKQYKRLQEQWDDSQTNWERMVTCIAVMCDLRPSFVRNLAPEDIATLGEKLVWVMSGDTRDHELIPRFTLNGTDYGFVPDWSQLSTGEFIDLETCGKNGYYNHLEEVMAIMYRRVTVSDGEHYKIEPYTPTERKSQAMQDAPMDVVMGAMGFFLTIGRQLANDTLNSFKAQEAQARLQKSGGGIKPFTTWLMGMFSKYKRSLNCR